MNRNFIDTSIPSESKSAPKKGKGSCIPKPKRGQANRRERVRTENVNVGFENLRKLIPTDPEDRKLSKIEVLRLATSYINHLYNLTKANSCLEAETLDPNSDSDRGAIEITSEVIRVDDTEQFGNNDTKRNFVGKSLILSANAKSTYKTTTKNHICTFCLMMTKTTATTNKTSGSTKRK